MEEFDLGIIGGSFASYTTALHVSKKAILFKKEAIGVCPIKNYILTKSVLHSSEIYSKFITN